MAGAGGCDRRAAYAFLPRDAVRETFEREAFGKLVPALLDAAGGGRLLDLGCHDGVAAELAGERLERYLGVDLHPPGSPPPRGDFLAHDLRDGLGPVGEEPFDVYLAAFGLASHLRPEELRGLLTSLAAHARPGSVVALEGLGRYSLEWPGLWDTAPGPARLLPYRLGGEVEVHPWAAGELFAVFEAAGIRPLRALDRSLQGGPKVGNGNYWPGLPPVRDGLNRLLAGDPGGGEPLAQPLPTLPSHPAAAVHHELAARRRALIAAVNGEPPDRVARAVWALEPRSGGGLGHGLLVIGRAA
jgi:hypothetical protein